MIKCERFDCDYFYDLVHIHNEASGNKWWSIIIISAILLCVLTYLSGVHWQWIYIYYIWYGFEVRAMTTEIATRFLWVHRNFPLFVIQCPLCVNLYRQSTHSVRMFNNKVIGIVYNAIKFEIFGTIYIVYHVCIYISLRFLYARLPSVICFKPRWYL